MTFICFCFSFGRHVLFLLFCSSGLDEIPLSRYSYRCYAHPRATIIFQGLSSPITIIFRPWLHRLRCPRFSQLMDDSVVEHFSCSHEFEHLREPPLRNHSRDSQSAPYLCFGMHGRLARSLYLQKALLIPPSRTTSFTSAPQSAAELRGSLSEYRGAPGFP